MATDSIQQNQIKTLIAHGKVSVEPHNLPARPLRGFELTREEDFISGDMDMFELLAKRGEKHTIWKMKRH